MQTELTVGLAVTIAIGMSAALIAWRERPEPGALPLVALLAGQSWWSATLVLELEATTLAAKDFWFDVGWIGIVLIPVAWFVFALEYTGRDRYVRPRYVGALCVIPAITILLAITGEYHSILYTDATLVERHGIVLFHRTPGPWFWVITGYTYLLGIGGSIPLLSLVTSNSLPFRGQSAALLFGVAAPWVANILHLIGVFPIPEFDPTPLAFGVSGVAYLGAITRFQLLGTSPAPNRRARRLVFERMQDSAVVVDGHDFVVDMNESAAEILQTTRRASIGTPASEVIPEYETLPSDGNARNTVRIEGPSGTRPYDVSVTIVSDFHDRAVGRVISFHDISEHVRHQQRLEVLNRVLRHNIRNETNVIFGYADLLAEAGDDEEYASVVKRRAMDIAEMGEKARQIIDIFDRREGGDPIRLADVLSDVVQAVRQAHPDVEVTCDEVPREVVVSEVLEPVVSNLIENGAEHNTAPQPWVHVGVTTDREAGRVRVVVTDNGPGIGAHERSVLERGSETSLEHGSGLGLWLVTWGAGVAGGSVQFEENDPQGSAVTVEVPLWDAAEESSGTTGGQPTESSPTA